MHFPSEAGHQFTLGYSFRFARLMRRKVHLLARSRTLISVCGALLLTSSMDMDLDPAMREFAAKMELLLKKCMMSDLDTDALDHITSLKDLARKLGS